MTPGRSGRARLAAIAPYCLVIFGLLVVPSIGVVEVSFREYSVMGLLGGNLTLANYAKILSPFELGTIWQTVKLSLLSTLFTAVFGYPVAYLVARSGPKQRPVLLLLVMIPFMTSVVVKVLGWTILLGPNGLLPDIAAWLGMGKISLMYNEGAVLLGLATFSMPLMIFSLIAAIERIPPSLEEAAANLGAGPAAIFFRVIFPLSWVGLVSGSLLCFSTSASAYVAPAVLGGRRVRMAGQQVYDQVMVVFNWPSGAALSVVLVILLGVIMYLALTVNQKGATQS